MRPCGESCSGWLLLEMFISSRLPYSLFFGQMVYNSRGRGWWQERERRQRKHRICMSNTKKEPKAMMMNWMMWAKWIRTITSQSMSATLVVGRGILQRKKNCGWYDKGMWLHIYGRRRALYGSSTFLLFGMSILCPFIFKHVIATKNVGCQLDFHVATLA